MGVPVVKSKYSTNQFGVLVNKYTNLQSDKFISTEVFVHNLGS